MSLVSSMFAGVSGLRANSQALQVIGDNIANVNTVGFKASKVIFGDILSTILANGSTNLQFGRGTLINGVTQSFEQGSFESTSNASDLSIDGSGFFIVNDGTGNYYTRAGQFRMNNSGMLADPNGNILQGFAITSGTTSPSLSNIDLTGVQSIPNASTAFTLGANLDAAASAGATFTSPITIYNSVGQEVILSLTFTKQSGVNSWTYVASSSVGSVSAATASGTISFNTSGQLSSPATEPTFIINYTGSPAALDSNITWNLLNASNTTNGKLTGYAAASNNNSIVQDGYSTGTLMGLSVDSDGIISGLFNNGQTTELFQVALADFLSPTGLNRVGQNLFSVSASSGQPVIGTANTGGFGSILGSSLELSNVDLAQEFVTLIQTQQAFQAASRIITTVDDLMTEAVNLKR